MHTNSTEKASPLYLNESYTERSKSQNGHRNSNRNSSKKSAVITNAHSKRNFTYSSVLLPICSAILFLLMGRRILPQSAFLLFIIRDAFSVPSPWWCRLRFASTEMISRTAFGATQIRQHRYQPDTRGNSSGGQRQGLAFNTFTETAELLVFFLQLSDPHGKRCGENYFSPCFCFSIFAVLNLERLFVDEAEVFRIICSF